MPHEIQGDDAPEQEVIVDNEYMRHANTSGHAGHTAFTILTGVLCLWMVARHQ